MNLLKTTELIRRILLHLCLKSVVQYIAQFASYEKYVSKLNTKCDRLWQYPRDTYFEENNEWFCNKPVGRDALGAFMTKLSKNVDFHKTIPITLIRATGATILSRQHFSNSQIMAVTGHKSVSSLAVCQRVSNQDKLQMGLAVSDGVSPTASDAKMPSTPRLLILIWLCRHQRHHIRCWLCHHQKYDVLC